MAVRKTRVNSEIIVVLGMHKSGTTLISQMLHHSGINMIEEDTSGSYYEGNFFERKSTNQINKVLLNSKGKKSWQITQKLDTRKVTPETDALALHCVSEISADHEHWGFKDPRSCLTYDFWQKHLPPHKLVCVYRNDTDLHSHYTQKHRHRPWRGIYALRAWYDYNQCILDIIEQSGSEYILIDYDELLAGDLEFERLEGFLGRPLTDKRRKSPRKNQTNNMVFRFCRYIAKNIYRRDIVKMYARLQQKRHETLK